MCMGNARSATATACPPLPRRRLQVSVCGMMGVYGVVAHTLSLSGVTHSVAAGSTSKQQRDEDEDEGSTPTVACDNPQCGRIYHRRCLRGWLSSTLPGTQTLGGGSGGRRLMGGGGGGGSVTLLGSCPYCTQVIALEVPFAAGSGVGE